jgi:hypothetical protein
VRCGSGGDHAQKSSGRDQILIRSANTFRTFSRDFARSHDAVSAARSGKAEATVGFLTVKTVKDAVQPLAGEIQEQFANGGIRGLSFHLDPARETFSVFRHSPDVIFPVSMGMFMVA